MEYKVKEIKQGIKVHLINNDKFKTNLIAVFLTTELIGKMLLKMLLYLLF